MSFNDSNLSAFKLPTSTLHLYQYISVGIVKWSIRTRGIQADEQPDSPVKAAQSTDCERRGCRPSQGLPPLSGWRKRTGWGECSSACSGVFYRGSGRNDLSEDLCCVTIPCCFSLQWVTKTVSQIAPYFLQYMMHYIGNRVSFGTHPNSHLNRQRMALPVVRAIKDKLWPSVYRVFTTVKKTSYRWENMQYTVIGSIKAVYIMYLRWAFTSAP